MRNLSDLIDLHNFHDGAILSEIIANWFESIHKISGLNHKMCNSDRTLRGCTERKKSEIFALPTNTDVIQLNENLLSESFICINTWVEYDTEILMTNLSAAAYQKINVEKYFLA